MLQPSPATGTIHIAPRNGRRLLQFAWIAIALIPVAFVAAMFIGEGLISFQGFEGDEFPPLGVRLLAAIPAGFVMIAPPVAAPVLDFRARRHGAALGIVPAVIGIVVIVYGIIANSLPRFLGT